jgi:hypothetical protein
LLLAEFLDDQTLEFTTVEEDGSRMSPSFQAAMVELLTLRSKCSPLRAKAGHISGHLPVTEEGFVQAAANLDQKVEHLVQKAASEIG